MRPILSNKCFQCHGPDEKVRKGKLRLDTRDDALTALNPGKPEASELLRRVTSTDTDEAMPPTKFGKKLTPREVEILTKWIKDGGNYSAHWSYVKPVRPAVPVVQNPKVPIRNPIDAFILARLQKEGLSPQAEADKYALIRRVSLDLTGLPPTTEEVAAFIKDTSPRAYEKLVDKLLAKPAYGEHWARLWLDLARYADSAGYADDPQRTIWKYRDWVINALNANKPFDQFTIEQLAGDLLPKPDDRSTRRDRVPPQHDDEQRGRHQRRGVPQRRRRGPREHDLHGLDGHLDGLRPVPHAQVRPDHRRRNISRSSRSSTTPPTPTAPTKAPRSRSGPPELLERKAELDSLVIDLEALAEGQEARRVQARARPPRGAQERASRGQAADDRARS